MAALLWHATIEKDHKRDKMPTTAPASLLSRRLWLAQSISAGATLASWSPLGRSAPLTGQAAANTSAVSGANPAKATAGGNADWPLRVLLIGNGAYSHNAVLRNPPRDTALLAKAFQARGAQVQVLGDQSASQLDAAIRSFLQARNNRAEALWLGYSGHAVQIGGRNYLQGVDSDFSTPARVRERGVDLDMILSLVERSGPPAAVVSIDACRNNPFEPERTRGLAIGLAAQEPKGLCVSFSTAPYTKALDGDDGQYSPYAQALANALAGQQSKSLDMVLRETADSVYRSTRQRQIPEYRSALRSEWWFGPRTISLRDTKANAQPQTSGNTSREVGYRPDEPAAEARYSQVDTRNWTQLDRDLQTGLRRMSDAQVLEIIRTTAQGRGDENQRLLAAMVLEDGHPAVRKQPAQARKLLLPMANQGHVLAQTLLGESFYIARDYAPAYKWLSLAARSNFPRATIDAGQMIAEARADGDPTAGALQTLRGMLEQGKASLPPNPGKPSPEAMEQAEQLRKLLQGR